MAAKEKSTDTQARCVSEYIAIPTRGDAEGAIVINDQHWEIVDSSQMPTDGDYRLVFQETASSPLGVATGQFLVFTTPGSLDAVRKAIETDSRFESVASNSSIPDCLIARCAPSERETIEWILSEFSHDGIARLVQEIVYQRQKR